MTPVILNASDASFPARLRERLGDAAPAQIFALGNLNLLALPKTALFCSTRCPGDAILRAYDQTAK
jgi:predicted Rossmann fold nucleotide-binding protein DprA/Smf involved in DNA uptake